MLIAAILGISGLLLALFLCARLLADAERAERERAQLRQAREETERAYLDALAQIRASVGRGERGDEA